MTTITNTGVTTTDLTSNTLETAGDILINTTGNPNLTVKTSGAGNNPFVRIQADTNYWDLQSIFSNTNDELDFRYNGSSRMMLTKDGYVLKPNQPSFHAYRSSTQSISGQVVFALNSTLHNIGGHYDTSTYQFTAPVTGSYFFSFKAFLYSMGTSEYFDFYPQVNGSNRRRYELTGNGGFHTQFDYSDVYYLNANDTVRMTGTDRSTGSYSLYPSENHFAGFLLG